MMNRRKVLIGTGSIVAAATGAATFASPAAAQVTGDLEIDDPAAVSTDDGSYQYVSMALASVFTWEGFDEPAVDVTFKAELRLPDDSEPDDGSYHELYNSTLALADLPPEGDRGGSLEWSTGEGHNGVLHTGVGDAAPILDRADGFRGHDVTDASVSAQHEDARWPILVSPDYTGDLYGVPDPLETDALEPEADGETNATTVDYHKTVTLATAEDYEVSETLEATFDVSITDIPNSMGGESEGTVETHTDENVTA